MAVRKPLDLEREFLAAFEHSGRVTAHLVRVLIQHDAHHRGQICTLTRSLGHEFSGSDVMRIWGWKKLP